jgi:predicted phosphodiesterase
MVARIIFVSVFCILPQSIYAIDITGKGLEVYLRGEYNRGVGGCVDLSVAGGLKPLGMLTLRGGLSAGGLAGAPAIKAFSAAAAGPFSNVPLQFSLLYIYNGLLGYDVHTHSILPVVSYNTARVGISYGPDFRFTSFFGEAAQFEPINSFSAYFDIINNEKRRLEAIVGNFGDFYAGNMGAYSLKLNYAEFIGGNWAVVNEIELLQSGSDALSANFYGLAWRGGREIFMVKAYKNIRWPALLLAAVCLFGCGYDFFGFFASSGLDDRLKERDNFILLAENDWKAPSFGANYSFIAVTDIHIKNGETYGVEGLKSVIKDPANNIRFMVVLGDITQNGSKSDLELFIDIAVNRFGIPCYPVIGNHDIYSGGWHAWKGLIGSTSYRIDGGSVTLLIMDSANLFLGKAQLDRLEWELKSAAGRVFVFTHANLFTANIEDPQQMTDINERARVVSILRDKCEAVFMGHVHEWFVNEAGGVKYIAVDAFHAASGTRKSYCLVTVNGDDVRYEYKKL